MSGENLKKDVASGLAAEGGARAPLPLGLFSGMAWAQRMRRTVAGHAPLGGRLRSWAALCGGRSGSAGTASRGAMESEDIEALESAVKYAHDNDFLEEENPMLQSGFLQFWLRFWTKEFEDRPPAA